VSALDLDKGFGRYSHIILQKFFAFASTVSSRWIGPYPTSSPLHALPCPGLITWIAEVLAVVL
jgi:hypothetical protein